MLEQRAQSVEVLRIQMGTTFGNVIGDLTDELVARRRGNELHLIVQRLEIRIDEFLRGVLVGHFVPVFNIESTASRNRSHWSMNGFSASSPSAVIR